MHKSASGQRGPKSKQSGESEDCGRAGGVIYAANEAASVLPFLHLMICLYSYFVLEKHRNCDCYYYCCIIITRWDNNTMQTKLIFYSVQ